MKPHIHYRLLLLATCVLIVTSCGTDLFIAEEIRYQGSEIVLVEDAPHGFGPGDTVLIDVDGDGSFEEETSIGVDGRFLIGLDTSALPTTT